MRIFEILKFVNALNESLILENFDALSKKYKNTDGSIAASEEDIKAAKAAYSELRNNSNLMTVFKKTLKQHGDFDQQIKLTYPTLQEFTKAVSGIKTNIKANADAKAAFKAAGHSSSQSNEMLKYKDYLHGDFYIIPCHTHEEVKAAANALTGKLVVGLATKDIKDRWIIEDDHVVEKKGLVKKSGSYYEEIEKPDPAHQGKTKLSKEQYLNVYKTAPFFMQPSWCIAGSTNGARYFDSHYNLKTDKDERAKCIVIISTKHPNVRFCITYKTKSTTKLPDGPITNLNQAEHTICEYKVIGSIAEFRDPWQIGDPREYGASMAQLYSNNLYNNLTKNNIIIEDDSIFESRTDELTTFKNWPHIISQRIKSILPDTPNCDTDILDITTDELFMHSSKLKSFNGRMPNVLSAPDMFASCTYLTEFTSDMPKLKDGNRMFFNCQSLNSFKANLQQLENGKNMFSSCYDLKNFDTVLPNLKIAELMFYQAGLSEFNVDMPQLMDATSMFFSSKIESFNGILPRLKDGAKMFFDCIHLKEFNIDLPELQTSESMFRDCARFTSFNGNLSKLKQGYGMFNGCVALSQFNSELPNLRDGSHMFSRCRSLESFDTDLSNLVNGNCMFSGCRNLTDFNSGLSKLMYADNMFSDCKLSEKSVINILNSIKQLNEENNKNSRPGFGKITITLGYEAGGNEIDMLVQKFTEKGWLAEIDVY